MSIIMGKKYKAGMMALLLCAAMLSGCTEVGNMPVVEETETAGEISSLGLTPEFNYEIPVSLPDIIVDQVGYASGSSKIAVFRGDTLPDTYDLIDMNTRESVYTGRIEMKGYNETTQETISYGDFTDFKTPGTYYLQAGIIGQSYPFVIADNPYDEIFNSALKQYYYNRCGLTLSAELASEAAHNACHTKLAQLKENADAQLDVSGGWHMNEMGVREVSEGCQAVSHLLLAYELYGGVFTDEVGIPESGNGIPDVMDEVKYEIDWLLKMQDATSGAVYSAVSAIDNSASTYLLSIEPVTMDATIQFAAAMAKFSYLYQAYDREFATQCLKAADRAYRYAGKYPEDVSAEAFFYAGTELYRATGNYGYRKAIQTYLNGEEELPMDNDYIFWGCVTYLSTKQSVDMKLCDRIISVLLRSVEEISFSSKNSKYLTEGNTEQDNHGELLWKMTRLAVADHIITNHEYATVLENHLHYFLGRNSQSISYINDTGSRNYQSIDERTGIMKRVNLNAELILLMSAVVDGLG